MSLVAPVQPCSIQDAPPGASRSIDCKRLYLPFVVTSSCPRCGVEVAHDLSKRHYLMYPEVDGVESVGFIHECPIAAPDDSDDYECEWSCLVRLRVTLEPVLPPPVTFTRAPSKESP